MKIYKCTSKYYDTGLVEYKIEKVNLNKRMKNTFESTPTCDTYVDYFVTLGELMDFTKGFDENAVCIP